jgi:hypothetical protein
MDWFEAFWFLYRAVHRERIRIGSESGIPLVHDVMGGIIVCSFPLLRYNLSINDFNIYILAISFSPCLTLESSDNLIHILFDITKLHQPRLGMQNKFFVKEKFKKYISKTNYECSHDLLHALLTCVNS